MKFGKWNSNATRLSSG